MIVIGATITPSFSTPITQYSSKVAFTTTSIRVSVTSSTANATATAKVYDRNQNLKTTVSFLSNENKFVLTEDGN